MFGYIAINKAEMKFKDFEVYHAYYCGLCRCLKEAFGKAGQATLSYDMTFVVLLLTGLYEPEEESGVTSCAAHPLEKHPWRTNCYTRYAADMNLILSYYKSLDDWKDEKSKKGLAASKLLERKISRLKEVYPEKIRVISENLDRLSALEQEDEKDLDLMAGLFGAIMAEITAYQADIWENSLRRIGFFLGKFIYLMDAYEDLEDDIRKGNYNPLKSSFENTQEFADHCRSLLTMMMAECSREFEKLPVLMHADIIRNILYSGVWCRYTDVTARRLAPAEPESVPETAHDTKPVPENKPENKENLQ